MVNQKLYHGGSQKINGPLQPILVKDRPGYEHTLATVFATERADIAALFMLPYEVLSSISFEQDIAFICIWGTSKQLKGKDIQGYLYILPSDSFEKIGKEYEWQSLKEVLPLEVKEYPDLIIGMMECGVQVYFINDDPTFDRIVESKYDRAPIVKELVSENQKLGINIKNFT